VRKLIGLLGVGVIALMLAGCKSTPPAQDEDSSSQGVHIYVADTENDRIVRIDDMAGHHWTEFGAWGLQTDHFAGPNCIFVDAQGHIYVGDTGSTEKGSISRIVRMDDMRGKNWVEFGQPGGGVGQFKDVSDIWVDDKTGRIFVADNKAHRIVCMDDMTGKGWVTYGREADPEGGRGSFFGPEGVSLDSRGRIYIADKSRIIRIDDMTGAHWTEYAPKDPIHGLSGACKVVLDSHDRLFIADRNNNRIVKVDGMDGSYWKACDTFIVEGDKAMFQKPHGLALDQQGRIYVTDGVGVDSTGDVLKMSRIVSLDNLSSGQAMSLGSSGKGDNEFDFPNSIYVR
jgi:streptogramin lyase